MPFFLSEEQGIRCNEQCCQITLKEKHKEALSIKVVRDLQDEDDSHCHDDACNSNPGAEAVANDTAFVEELVVKFLAVSVVQRRVLLAQECCSANRQQDHN